ncbi:acyl-coenzyme A synthetase/AMP-(fatty) acid ligase [Acidovorax soli]|uniref:Acyl-coenzyme A synthetase/AMP-(Fatty) acid ligase n=1 Tax=Acidovorax soli TaxID=592050 RepID=A0A7X0PHT9_9BURK|nr:AMP-binding protein [Acidovorax soli]MBB6562205.1 acyl-coenzyme A synthetase/AMP-(fatty) acid ligase [Acidovorax soli]
MNTFTALSEVALPQARAAGHEVAASAGSPVRHADWVLSVKAWCAAFQQVQGTEVGLYFEEPLQFAAALWGAWHAGKTPVLASDLQPHTLAHLLPQVQACAGQLPDALVPDTTGAAAVQLQPLSMRAAQVVLFTSGSTGVPERIVKHLSQLDAEVHALQAVFGPMANEPGLRTLATVSHQHIYGLLFRVLWPLAAGRLLGTGFARYPEELVAQLSPPGPTLLISSPAMLSRLPDHLDWAAASQGLRGIFSSGGPLPPEASAHALALLGHSTTEVFGSSETGGIAWRRRAEQGDAWQPLPGVQVRLADSGCLSVRSGHLPDADAWWETADRALPQDGGDGGAGFVLQGRADRIAKIAEKRISLTAMENALLASDRVAAARAVVLEAPPAAARVGMVLALTEAGWQALQQQGRKPMGDALRALLAPVVDRVALPRSWRYVAALPQNAQGKTTQHDLLALFRPLMPLPEWTERSAHQATASLLVDPGLRVLDGHFPGAPIVPGVAQLHWVVTLGQQAFGIPAAFLRAEVVKFQQPILPGDRVQVQLQWVPGKGQLQFALTSGRGPHASGRLVQGEGAA